jgi:hypothetical protein
MQCVDYSNQRLPGGYDLVWSRDSLQHISMHGAWQFLNNVKASGAKYLLVGSYIKSGNPNGNIAAGAQLIVSVGCVQLPEGGRTSSARRTSSASTQGLMTSTQCYRLHQPSLGGQAEPGAIFQTADTPSWASTHADVRMCVSLLSLLYMCPLTDPLAGGYYDIDLLKEPFKLSKPLEIIDEQSSDGKHMLLFDVQGMTWEDPLDGLV